MNPFKKHSRVLKAAEDYYVNNIPTGLSDEEYNYLEKLAIDDGINPRDEAFKLLRGSWVDNADYITDVPKVQVKGSMYDSLLGYLRSNSVIDHESVSYGDDICDLRLIPKYDGSSIICYYENGIPYKVVTAGGMNKNGQGVDQTWKLLKYFPEIDPRIKSLHCEALVSLEHGFGEKSRQKANGLINSTKDNMLEEVDKYINIRAFRYFSDYDLDYLEIMRSLPMVSNENGDIKFSAGWTYTYDEMFGLDSPYSLSSNELESDIINTPTGTFLIDGWVFYTKLGKVIQAMKFHSAGRGEFSKVIEIKWSDNSKKGKDSFSAVAVIEPIEIRGSKITKPSCPVNKIIKDGLGIGSLVSIILANETIPKVDQVNTRSNKVNLPTCPCGTLVTLDSVFGNNLKCPNPDCSYRYNNMSRYLEDGSMDEFLLGNMNVFPNLSYLNGLFRIDRFKFEDKIVDSESFIRDMYYIIYNGNNDRELFDLINSLSLTSLARKNLELVYKPAYRALYDRMGMLVKC